MIQVHLKYVILFPTSILYSSISKNKLINKCGHSSLYIPCMLVSFWFLDFCSCCFLIFNTLLNELLNMSKFYPFFPLMKTQLSGFNKFLQLDRIFLFSKPMLSNKPLHSDGNAPLSNTVNINQ